MGDCALLGPGIERRTLNPKALRQSGDVQVLLHQSVHDPSLNAPRIQPLSLWPTEHALCILLYLEAATDLRWYLWDSLAAAKLTGLSVVPANEWHHFICGYNSLDSKGFLYIDNGSVLQSAALTGGINQPIVTFNIHSLEGGVFANSGSLILDEVIFWSRVLTALERERLFNLGKGYFYPFVP